VFLDLACEGIQMAGPSMAAERPPGRLSFTGGAYGTIDLGGRRLRESGDRLAAGGVQRLKGLTLPRNPGAADEQPKLPVVALQPFIHWPHALGRGTVRHCLEDFGNR